MNSTALVIDESKAILAHHAKSFHFASRFLPAAIAENTAVLYAFCRLIDDSVDEAATREIAVQELGLIDDELTGRRSPRPLLFTFREMMSQTQMDARYPMELIEGVRSDLNEVAIQTEDELKRYSYLVASTVGLMMCAIIKVRDQNALKYAIDLGIAMQMTNIARDVHEDDARNRTYVPKVWWSDRGRITSADTLRLLDLADEHYVRARIGYPAIPFFSRLAVSVAAEVYRAIGLVIRKNPTQALSQRCSTSKFQKIIAMFKGLFRAI